MSAQARQPGRGLDLGLLHKIGAYTMVGATFLALWGGQAFPVAIGGVCLLLGAASWFWEAPRFDLGRFGWVWTALTVGFLLFCGYLLAFTEQGFVDVGVYLVLFLTVAKLFQRARLVDYQQLFALSFLLLAAATAFNEDLTFGFVFIVYVICGVITVAMHHLLVQLEENAGRGGAPVRQLFGRQYVTLLTALSVLIFGASVAFFFLFPRLGFGFFVSKARDSAQTTGFSESVDLGSHGRIKDDGTVVMRVEFPEGRPAEAASLHWRGVSFDYYDGTRWTSELDHDRMVPADFDGRFAVQDRPAWASAPLVQAIYLEPIGSSVMFGVHPVEALQLAEKDQSALILLNRHRVTVGAGGDLRHTMRASPRAPFQPMSVGYQYKVTSWPELPPAAALRALPAEDRLKGLTEHGAAAYLQLPPESDPLRELAEDITRGARTDLDRVIAVERYLKSEYTYTTDLPDPGDEPPLHAFLFTHKRGHCEYFATAMVILLRTLGVPARSVNGFLGGQWNDFDDFLAVRNADAHSWVEVWFSGFGWVTFDPTPSAANMSAQTSAWDPLLQLYDSLRFKWVKYIIEYDLETQVEVLRSAFAAASGQEEQESPQEFAFTLRDLVLDLRFNLLPMALIVVISLAGGVVIRIRYGVPLGMLDGLLAVVAISSSVLIALLLWRPEATGSVLATAAAIPTLTTGLAAWLRRPRRGGSAALPALAAARQYGTLRQALYRYALPPLPAEGPQRLMERVLVSPLDERSAIARLIERYMRARFGGEPLTAQEDRAYQREVRRLVRVLKRSSRGA